MIRWGSILLAVVVALAVGALAGVAAERAGIVRWPVRPSSAAPSADPAPSPPERGVVVRVASATAGHVDVVVEMLGSVERLPEATIAATLPSDIVVQTVLASPGQHVAAGTPIVRVQPTMGARNQIDAARAAVESAQATLESARARLDAKLGTRSDVVQAEQLLRSAEVQLAVLQGTLPPEDGVLRAGADGVVLSIDAPVGSMVAAGQPLFAIARDGEVAVRFGLPPASMKVLPVGTPVTVSPLLSSVHGTLDSVVERVEGTVDPGSRMVTAWTGRMPEEAWLPGTPVRVNAKAASREGIVVPRGSVLLTDEGFALFVVKDGVVHAHAIEVLAGNAESVCVKADAVAAGDLVVVAGGYGLEDGMAVTVEGGQ